MKFDPYLHAAHAACWVETGEANETAKKIKQNEDSQDRRREEPRWDSRQRKQAACTRKAA